MSQDYGTDFIFLNSVNQFGPYLQFGLDISMISPLFTLIVTHFVHFHEVLSPVG